MKTSAGALRTTAYLLFVLLISAGLAACGGGGGGTSSTSPGAAGPATVGISIAAADVTGSAAPVVTLSGSGGTLPTTDPTFQWPEQVDPRIAHVYMDVVKVSLMPSAEPSDDGSIDGDFTNGNSPDPAPPSDKSNFITLIPGEPIHIDLLNLDNGAKLASFLNKFDQVPAGTYDKIRVYYKNVTVELVGGGTMRFHPTAHSKFDIHFRQGHELVIPVASDTTQAPDGWIKFYSVKLDVVGLKLMVVGGGKNWNGSKVILRPQIFAEFVPPILYSVAGTASKVSSVSTPLVSGTFDISFGSGSGFRLINVAFDNSTTWTYSDNVLGDSTLVPSWTVPDVLNSTAVLAFRNRAKVMAIGPFDSSTAPPVLQATDIVFEFPDVRQGKSDNVWLPPDNVAFIVHWFADNVTVFPQPSRSGAYYDNLIANLSGQHIQLYDTALDNSLTVRARGYIDDIDTLKLWSYWISIGEPAGP